MPPNNTPYMYAGYAAAAIIYGAYALSLWLRSRRLRGRASPHAE